MHLPPLKKQDAQIAGLQGGNPFLFLVSLPPAGRGWFATQSLQATAASLVNRTVVGIMNVIIAISRFAPAAVPELLR